MHGATRGGGSEMASITVTTTEEEQLSVLAAIATFKNETVAMSAIAKKAGINQNRVRYVITDLEEAGKIKRVPTKAFNARYVRYQYIILKEATTK